MSVSWKIVNAIALESCGCECLIFFFSFGRAVQCQCLGGLVSYFSVSPELDRPIDDSATWYAVGLILCAFLSSSITNPFLLYTFQKGLQIRVALSSLVFNKVFFG